MSDAYKIFRQLQEREKEAQQYKNYEREDLIDEIINLQQENQQLKEELQKANDTLDTHNELINHLQEVIEEVREYTTNEMRIVNDNEYHKLLQILDKVKGEDNE